VGAVELRGMVSYVYWSSTGAVVCRRKRGNSVESV